PVIVGATPAAVTVAVTVADLPSIVAVICAVPAVTPLTRPPPLVTLATAGALDDQLADLPLTTSPALLRAVAVSCRSSPTSSAGSAGAIVTVATRFGSGPVESPQANRNAADRSTIGRRKGEGRFTTP